MSVIALYPFSSLKIVDAYMFVYVQQWCILDCQSAQNQVNLLGLRMQHEL